MADIVERLRERPQVHINLEKTLLFPGLKYKDSEPTLDCLAADEIDRLRGENADLKLAIERWKIEELQQLQCQCAKPRTFDLNGIPWCEGCERPTRWEDVKLRPDEAALMQTAAIGAAVQPSAALFAPRPVSQESLNAPFGPADGSGDWQGFNERRRTATPPATAWPGPWGLCADGMPHTPRPRSEPMACGRCGNELSADKSPAGQ